MNGRIKALLAVAALGLAAACADRGITAPTAPLGAKGGGGFPMTFTVAQSYDAGTAQTAAGGAGVVDFAGSFQTPTPCYDVTAANGASKGITVTVTAVDNGNICPQVITWQNYTGQLTGVGPGSYALRVVHVVAGRSRTAWNGTIVVR